jgi:hypothetical protein
MRLMIVVGCALALCVQTALAQTSEKPRELNVAPSAGNQTPEATAPQGGTPAKICQELLAFVQQQAAKQSAGTPNAPAPPAPQTAGPGQTAPAVDKPQQTSGQSGAVPGNPAGSTQTNITPEQAQSLAGANDLRGCQKAAQSMRRAGVALPEGLIALAALREDLLVSQPQQ